MYDKSSRVFVCIHVSFFTLNGRGKGKRKVMSSATEWQRRQACFLSDISTITLRYFHSYQNAIRLQKRKLSYRERKREKLLSEGNKERKKNSFSSLFQFLGFTNTCHVNEAAAISLVPGA